MKYVLIVFDGMADEPIADLDGKTPMMVARKPYMNGLAERGIVGVAHTTPQGMQPGSDVTNMAILGYDPNRYYTGRAAIEAASLEIPMDPMDVAFRANLVSTDGELMVDSSAGHVSTEEARELIELVDSKLSTRSMKFYPGVSYRHIMIWHDGSMDIHCTPPYKIEGQPFAKYLPEGDGDNKFQQMIYDSLELLDNHPINQKRRDEGHNPANMLWFWGQGTMPEMPAFFSRFGLTGSVIAAVDLIKGLGKMVGLRVPEVPGATGYVDTNYLAKARYALAALQEQDFVWVHVEAADEAGHEKDLDKKIAAIQDEDEKILGTILNNIKDIDPEFKILVLPDHPTPIATGSHTSTPVPFVLYDSRRDTSNNLPFDERVLEESKALRVEEGHRLIERLLE